MRIEGEYPTVSFNVTNPERLRNAHLTPCTPDEAARLLLNMMEFHKCQIKKLKFSERCNGVYYHKERYIRLPKIPLPPGCNRPYYYLTIGCVIHEYAHVLANDVGEHGHGWGFILIIQKLIDRYYDGDYNTK